VLTAQNISKRYPNGVHALRGVSLSLKHGDFLGLLGVSGCGKSTLARLLCALENFQSGAIHLDGLSYRNITGKSLRRLRQRVQLVFQDSSGSLDPRRTVFQTLEEPLTNYPRIIFGERLSRRVLTEKIAELLAGVGLGMDKAASYPHELSGGQRQRVVIARALATKPEYLICDEPVSSLDAETREPILDLLSSLRQTTSLGILFITHDAALARRMCGAIMVMREGRLVETLNPASAPQKDPYTRALFEAAHA
jgi:ABC-type dipeptide/oligopeptide/nickel transport system ATPase subunit